MDVHCFIVYNSEKLQMDYMIINREVKYILNVFWFLCATECLQQLKEQGRCMHSDIKGYQAIQWGKKKQVAEQYTTA